MKKIVSWPQFLTYWDEKFSRIKATKKGADTCTDCLVLVNQFRTFRSRDILRIEAASMDDSEENNSGAEIVREIEGSEEIIAKVKFHVKQYQT